MASHNLETVMHSHQQGFNLSPRSDMGPLVPIRKEVNHQETRVPHLKKRGLARLVDLRNRRGCRQQPTGCMGNNETRCSQAEQDFIGRFLQQPSPDGRPNDHQTAERVE